jgi:L-aminopeptidase/D-esterase-like protein
LRWTTTFSLLFVPSFLNATKEKSKKKNELRTAMWEGVERMMEAQARPGKIAGTGMCSSKVKGGEGPDQLRTIAGGTVKATVGMGMHNYWPRTGVWW